jgi:hypothetical protein
MGVKQIVPFVWPEGEHRPIAMLELEPPELTRRYGLVWEEGIDQLDEYLQAAIELVDGSEVKLKQYPRVPEGGTGTIIYTLLEANWDRVRSLVLETLELPPSAYIWVSEVTEEDKKQELLQYLAWLEQTVPNGREDRKQALKQYLARLGHNGSMTEVAEE